MTTELPNPKELIKQFPKRYGYATKVSQRLHQQGILVSESAIYHVIKGNTFNPIVINALMDEFESYKAAQSQINQRFMTIKEA